MHYHDYGTYVEQYPSDTVLLIRENVTFLFPANMMSSLADVCIKLADQRNGVSYCDLCQKFQPPYSAAISFNSETPNHKELFAKYVKFWNENCDCISASDFSHALSALVYLCNNNRRYCDDVHYFFWTIESHLNAIKQAKSLSLVEL